MTRGLGDTMSRARQVAYLSAAAAVAIIFSYAEAILPISLLPLPGFRLGFANIVTLLILRRFGLKSALCVSVVRTLTVALLFSSLISAAFSIAGGMAALLAMYGCGRARVFSIFGQSVAGATAHNLGQLAVAAVPFGLRAAAAYLPYLMICSLIAGLLIGVAAALIEKTAIFSKASHR